MTCCLGKAMNETGLASSASQRTHLPLTPVRSQLGALEALERGFGLFRSTFAREAWRYYMGAAPIVISIPIWIINGQIRITSGMLVAETFLLAGSYLLRVWMVASYMQHVRGAAFSTPIAVPGGLVVRTAVVGRLLAWKVMLSAGALATLPSIAGGAWFYSACQFASLDAQADGTEKKSLSGCLALAGQWFGNSVLLLLIVIPVWTAIWLNSLILAMLAPQLLHSIFGVNTLISTQMGVFALIRSSAFWLALMAGTWLALDPVVKCTFIVVYQHLRSRREGDDLRGRLACLPREHQKMSQLIAPRASGSKVANGGLLVVALILSGLALTGNAQAVQVSPTQRPGAAADNPARQARIEQLRQALDKESQRAIYRWHDAERPDPPTWFDKLLARIARAIGRAWDKVWNFLRKLWPSGLNVSPGNERHGTWKLKDIRLWLIVIGILTLATAAVLIWLRRRRSTASVTIPMEVAPVLDLNDTAAASERSEDEWFALASHLEGEGELLYALRATYLGLLAGLSQREWLTIRRDHTNREYLNEFTRRWRRRPQAAVEARTEIPEKLRGSLRQFDRVWYGSYVVTQEMAATYRQEQREFLSHV